MSLSLTPAPDESLQTVIAHSSIHTHEFSPPMADWATIRKSADVDAFVLAWIVSHVRGMQGGHNA